MHCPHFLPKPKGPKSPYRFKLQTPKVSCSVSHLHSPCPEVPFSIVPCLRRAFFLVSSPEVLYFTVPSNQITLPLRSCSLQDCLS